MIHKTSWNLLSLVVLAHAGLLCAVTTPDAVGGDCYRPPYDFTGRDTFVYALGDAVVSASAAAATNPILPATVIAVAMSARGGERHAGHGLSVFSHQVASETDTSAYSTMDTSESREATIAAIMALPVEADDMALASASPPQVESEAVSRKRDSVESDSPYYPPLTRTYRRVYRNTLQIRSSPFYHSSGRFREIYGNVGSSFGVEVSTRLRYCREAWLNIDFFSKHSDQGPCCQTWVKLLNTSFGVKRVFPLGSSLEGYLGLGPSLTWIYLKNDTCCVVERISKVAMGVVLKSGFRFHFYGPLFVDLFADYLYQPIHFDTTVDLGGLKTGVGLGMRF